MPRRLRLSLLLTIAITLAGGNDLTLARIGHADDGQKFTPAQLDFFEQKIRPVFVSHCAECHSATSKEIKGGLLLDSRKGLLVGGDSGAAIVPGNVDDSLLIQSLRYGEDSQQMPPKGKLPAAVIADFEAWVKMGAPDPRAGQPTQPVKKTIDLEGGRQFWAFQPPRKQAPPEVKNSAGKNSTDNKSNDKSSPEKPAAWARSEIDRYVIAGLEQRGLAPAADTDRRTLLRRVSYDLTGLPPTPQEVDEFLQDESADALVKVVDRLLASPRFGERWGRHWMDVVRYADSNGMGANFVFDDAWRYRDYIIQSFNNDKPYDQFVIEQLAGDLLPGDTEGKRREQLVATGFLVIGLKELAEYDKDKLRMDVVDEQVDTIGRALMGLTLGCARCHDHKFDPIPTADYYALAGILRSTVTIPEKNKEGPISDWNRRALPTSKTELASVKQHAARISKAKDGLARSQNDVRQLTKQIADAASSANKPTTAAKPTAAPSIVVDNDQAQLTGFWRESVGQTKDKKLIPKFFGKNYLHDDQIDRGKKSVAFKAKLPAAGRYEVRMAYTANPNRATRVPVTIHDSEGAKLVHVNQREVAPIESLWRSLDEYSFKADQETSVVIANDGTDDGFVIADAIEFVPVQAGAAAAASKKPAPPSNKDREKSLAKAKEQVKKLQEEIQLLEADPAALIALAVADDPQPADLKICIRGDIQNRGDVAPRGFLQVATHAAMKQSATPKINPKQSGRLELARWIADPQHPLTSRVMANRIWRHMLGAGLVRTVDNFGVRGELPSHPELLDYLAIRFVEQGWSVKALVREIALSRTYQLSSDFSSGNFTADPDNRLLWRHNRRRLEAEAIRDSILVVSGQLDSTAGGSTNVFSGRLGTESRTVVIPADPWRRRSVYLPIYRGGFVMDLLRAFDFADPGMVTGVRSTTTVPTQALYLMNSVFVMEQAEHASRLLLELPDLDDTARLELLYRKLVARSPSEVERQRGLEFLRQHQKAGRATAEVAKPLEANISADGKVAPAGAEPSAHEQLHRQAWASLCHVLFAGNEFLFLD